MFRPPANGRSIGALLGTGNSYPPAQRTRGHKATSQNYRLYFTTNGHRSKFDKGVIAAMASRCSHGGIFEQLYSSPSDREREKNKQKTIYNKHQNTIGTLDYQAVAHV